MYRALLVGTITSLLSTAVWAKQDLNPPQSAKKDAQPSNWTFEASAGIPKLDGDEFGFIGDAAFAYAQPNWGLGGSLAVDTYTQAGEDVLSSNSRNKFQLEYWYRPPATTEGWRLEGRAEFSVGTFATIYSANLAGGGEIQTESSSLQRLNGLIGLRAPSSSDLTWAVYAGVGLQSEAYVQTGQGGDDGFSATSSYRLLARFEAQQSISSSFSIRLKSEISRYEMRRLAIFFEGDLDDSFAVQTLTSLESNNRLSGQFDGVEWLGLHPNVFIGLDWISISGDAGSNATFVPSIGAGLRG